MITFNVINNNIVGSLAGADFSTPYTQDKWDQLERALKEINSAQSTKEAKEILEKASKLVNESTGTALEDHTPFLAYNPEYKTYHLKNDGKVSPISLPQNLVDKMKYAVDKGLPVDPLVKFTIRALRNPNVYDGVDATYFLHQASSYVFQTFVSPSLYKKFTEEDGFSNEVAREKATVPQTPITMEGLLSTKKVVSPMWDLMRYKYIKDENGNPKRVLRDPNSKEVDEDTGDVTWNDVEYAEDMIFQPYIMKSSGDEFYCGTPGQGGEKGHVLRVGQLMALESWDQVNTNENATCVKGLHTGNHDYIRGFEHHDSYTVNCFVDPAFIGTIPLYDIPGVLRVKETFIHSIKDRDVDNRNLYHSSTYAQQTDLAWSKQRQEIIDKFDEEQAEIIAKFEERKSRLM